MIYYSLRLSVIILVIYYEIRCTKCDFVYCDNLPACLNKPHIFCKRTEIAQPRLYKATISAILDPLNDYRTSIRNKMSVCNLPNLKWNDDLELLAWQCASHGFDNFCYITTDYKNILYFELKLSSIRSITRNNISNEFKLLTSSINQKDSTKFWLSSAFSQEIGCVRSYGKQITCLITGTKLNYFNQSFGYENECNRTSTLNDKMCRHHDNKYSCIDHFICESYDSFPKVRLLSLDFTTTKFILMKLENDNKSVKWDYDLEYLAEKLVTQQLTSSDTCFAQALFRNMRDHHFKDVQYFTEPMSSVDSVWGRNRIANKVGCVAYHTTDNITSFYNLYCLYDQYPKTSVKINIVNHFIAHITTNEFCRWLTTGIIFLFVVCTSLCIWLCILQAYIVCITKKVRTARIDLNDPIYEIVNNIYNL